MIEPHTRGNPYETVELLNALRRDGLLTATAAAGGGGTTRPCARTWAAPRSPGCWRRGSRPCRRASRRLVEAMACLGGRAELSVLQAATGEPADVVEQSSGARARRGPAGGGARGAGGGAVPPRPHPRGGPGRAGPAAATRPAAGDGAAAGRVPELFAVAAEQYLPVVDAVDDADGAASGGAAAAARRRPGDVDRRLRAGERAAGGRAAAGRPGETATLVEVHTGRHAALFSLGAWTRRTRSTARSTRLCPHRAGARGRDGGAGAQPDPPEPFRRGDRLWPEVAARARHRPSRPRTGSPPSSTASSRHLYRWLDDTDAADDLARPEHHRPDAARRDPPDQRDPAGGLLRRRPAHVRLAEPGGAADLARARPGPYPGRPRGQRRLPRSWPSAATTPPGTGRCGGSWRWARPAATSPTPRRRASCSPLLSLLVRADRKRRPRRRSGPGRG